MESKFSTKFSCKNCKVLSLSLFDNGNENSDCSLIKNKEELTFQKGEEIIKFDEPFSGFYCIQSGTIKISKPVKEKTEFILWFAKPGESIGIDSFFNNENYQYSAIATGPVKVCFFKTPKIKDLVENGSSTYLKLMEYFCKRIDFIEKRITSIAQKKTKSHLAELLIVLRENSIDGDFETTMDYSIKDLANIIGTTQNYLYKISSELIKDKIISFERKKLKILDPEKLAYIAKG